MDYHIYTFSAIIYIIYIYIQFLLLFLFPSVPDNAFATAINLFLNPPAPSVLPSPPLPLPNKAAKPMQNVKQLQKVKEGQANYKSEKQ